MAGLSFAAPNKEKRREMREDADIAEKPGKTERREVKHDAAGGGEKPAVQDQQAKFLLKLREQFDVADDAEWEVLAARIAKLADLRRGAAAGATGANVASVPNNKRSGRSPEQDALRAAVADKLPEAEVRARLSRLHDVRLQEEAKIAKAQEELRAVLTVRQEAVAVMVGLLPP